MPPLPDVRSASRARRGLQGPLSTGIGATYVYPKCSCSIDACRHHGGWTVEFAAEQSSAGDFDFGIPNGLSFVYDRDGATLTARGVTSGYVESDSIGLANHWLLVGSNRDVEGHFCQTELHTCLGRGNIFDLNRFAPAY